MRSNILLAPNITDRSRRAYWKRFESHGWFDTGDAGMIDQDGYVHVLSRADDVMNVAGHRLSTSLLEQGKKILSVIKNLRSVLLIPSK